MSIRAYIFPGQGAQFSGMAKDLYESHAEAKALLTEADSILGYAITETMFSGTDEALKQTNITQPAIFLHSMAAVKAAGADFDPQMVAGHSLGEFSALAASGAMDWQDALRLVSLRANAMQHACEIRPSTMAAILGLDDMAVRAACEEVNNGGDTVVAANFNAPGQVVISGSVEGVNKACELLKSRGAKRALVLQVGGAFHSPLMEPARAQLAAAIESVLIRKPLCPIYQNVSAEPATEPAQIKANLVAQLTAPVLWTQCVEAMHRDGATEFIEMGPGKVLTGLVKKIIVS